MSIVLFALIGASINAGVTYWICFSIYCMLKVINFFLNILNETN